MPTWALALVLLAFSYAFSLVKWRRRSRGLPLPPGPKSWPFIGNLAHMGKPEPWKAHHELSQQYGECYRTCYWTARSLLTAVLQVNSYTCPSWANPLRFSEVLE